MLFENSALFVVDAEQGFSELCPDELPVPGALEIVPVINKLLLKPWKYKIATKDVHPEDHCSFKEFGGPYNSHCVKNKKGSFFLPGLNEQDFHAIFHKGLHKDHDAPSVFRDHPYIQYMLSEVTDVFFAGICTNICVVETAFDCARFDPLLLDWIHIIEDACATLPLPADHPYCQETMRKKAESLYINYINSELLETWKS